MEGRSEMDMGRIRPSVGSGWVGLCHKYFHFQCVGSGPLCKNDKNTIYSRCE